MTNDEKWAWVIDEGKRRNESIHVELRGNEHEVRIDPHRWAPEAPLNLPPEFPNGFGPPPPEEQWMLRRVIITRLSKEGGVYRHQRVVRTIYEIKPEVIMP